MACNDVSRLFFFFYELIYTFHLFDYDNGIIAHCTEEVLLVKPADRWICRIYLCSCIRKMLICVNTEWILSPGTCLSHLLSPLHLQKQSRHLPHSLAGLFMQFYKIANLNQLLFVYLSHKSQAVWLKYKV